MRRWRLVGPQPEPALVQGLDDLVDRLLAEVRDRGQLALGLGDEVAHRLDPRPLEAVVRADAELELLDEDVVHRAAAGAAAARRDGVGVRAARAVVERGDARRAGAQLLDAVLVGEDRQGGDEDLRRIAQRRLGIDRAVRLDVERELVVVRALADARTFDVVGHAPHGREDRVDGDDADRLVGGLVVLGRTVPAPAADREVELELGLLLERGDVRVRVEDLDARGQVDVARGDVAGAGDDERRLDLGGVRVHAAHDALEIEDDVRHVLGDALDGRELVRHPLDADRGHGGTGQRRQQHAAQRVAERVAEAAVEWLDREGAAVVLDRLGGDSGDLEVEHQGPNVVGGWSGPGRGQQGAWPRAGKDGYFEYSSTMSCSCTGAAISRRSGLRSTFAVSESWSACSHGGTCAVSSVASRMTRSAPSLPARTAITSLSRT